MACVKCQEVCKLFSWLFCALIYGGERGTQKIYLSDRFTLAAIFCLGAGRKTQLGYGKSLQ